MGIPALFPVGYDTLKTIPPFIIKGLSFIFVLNLILISITSIYFRKKLEGKKRRITPALIFLCITIIVNFTYYTMTRKKLLNYNYKVPVQDVVMPDPGPPKRDFSYLEKHRITRDERFKSYFAVDEEGVILCLRAWENPQMYDSSFYLTMQKEGKTFNTREDFLEYARFIILLYYCESEPAYIESPSNLLTILKNRKNKPQDNLAEKVAGIIPMIQKENKDEYKRKSNDPDDLKDNEDKKNSDSNEFLKELVSQISPPKFEKEWDKGVVFNLYTYSFRHNELAKWKFKIFPNGNVEVEKEMSYIGN